jgi:hypothetical protein
MSRKRLTWKTFSLTDYDAMRRLKGAWGSSSQAFGKGRVVTFGATSDVETNLPLRDLRTLLRHASVRIPGGFDNGIVWDSMSLDERYAQEEQRRWNPPP